MDQRRRGLSARERIAESELSNEEIANEVNAGLALPLVSPELVERWRIGHGPEPANDVLELLPGPADLRSKPLLKPWRFATEPGGDGRDGNEALEDS